MYNLRRRLETLRSDRLYAKTGKVVKKYRADLARSFDSTPYEDEEEFLDFAMKLCDDFLEAIGHEETIDGVRYDNSPRMFWRNAYGRLTVRWPAPSEPIEFEGDEVRM